MTASPATPAAITTFLKSVATRAGESGAFATVSHTHSHVHAIDPVQPDAAYRISFEEGKLWVTWVSANRYLSQSIEAEVRWTGDDIDELVDEELADQGWSGTKIGRFQHFRSEDKLFTFRSELPLNPQSLTEADTEAALRFLLAYQAAFRNIGDMKDDEEG